MNGISTNICDKKMADLEYPVFDPDIGCPVYWSLGLMTAVSRETCGKDTLCREGSLQLAAVFFDIAEGKGTGEDIELSHELLQVIRANANCEMARDAADKCLGLIEEYYDIWEQHVARKRCPNLICTALVNIYISPETCTGCGKCADVCPSGAILGGDGMIHVISNEKCTRCPACSDVCPVSAVKKATTGAIIRVPEAPIAVGSFEGAASGEGRRRRRRG